MDGGCRPRWLSDNSNSTAWLRGSWTGWALTWQQAQGSEERLLFLSLQLRWTHIFALFVIGSPWVAGCIAAAGCSSLWRLAGLSQGQGEGAKLNAAVTIWPQLTRLQLCSLAQKGTLRAGIRQTQAPHIPISLHSVWPWDKETQETFPLTLTELSKEMCFLPYYMMC